MGAENLQPSFYFKLVVYSMLTFVCTFCFFHIIMQFMHWGLEVYARPCNFLESSALYGVVHVSNGVATKVLPR
jgi:hypothetical protein